MLGLPPDMNKMAIRLWRTESSTGWFTMPIASRCAATQRAKTEVRPHRAHHRGSDGHATLRFDPDCVRKSLDGMNFVARIDVLRPDFPAACRRNIYASHHESPAVVNAATRQTVPNQRRFAIKSVSHNSQSRALLQFVASPKIRQLLPCKTVESPLTLHYGPKRGSSVKKLATSC